MRKLSKKNRYFGDCIVCNSLLLTPHATGKCGDCRTFFCRLCKTKVSRYNSAQLNNKLCAHCNVKRIAAAVSTRRVLGSVSV